MKKICFIISAVMMAVVSAKTIAGNIYLGPTLLLQDVTANNSRFRGIHPSVSLGYAQMLEYVYLAGEIFAYPATATLSDHHQQSVSAKMTHAMGLSFIPGLLLSDKTVVFARLGLINAKFNGPNQSKTGAQAGLGLMTSLTPYWDMRFEFVYSAYPSLSKLGAPVSDEFGIGFMYNFV